MYGASDFCGAQYRCVRSLQHRGDIPTRKVASRCARHIIDEAATIPALNGDPLNIFHACRSEVVPDENVITVQDNLEKSPMTTAAVCEQAKAGLRAFWRCGTWLHARRA